MTMIPPEAAKLVALLDGRPDGMTVTELSALTGKSTRLLWQHLNLARCRGAVADTKSIGGRPLNRWCTPRHLARAQRLAIENYMLSLAAQAALRRGRNEAAKAAKRAARGEPEPPPKKAPLDPGVIPDVIPVRQTVVPANDAKRMRVKGPVSVFDMDGWA